MRYLIDLANAGQKASTLIILLPGAGDMPEDFITRSFVQTVRERNLDIDLILVELPFEHIADLTALHGLNREVVQAMRSQYHMIWLAGISIGGYVAMAHAHRYPGQVQGLLLMAPYPVNRMITSEIASAGGLHAWEPEVITDDDTERGNWYWLKHSKEVEIYLGYGTEDRFADGISLMEQAVSPTRMDKVPGGHTWQVWQQLWINFLNKQPTLQNQVKRQNTVASTRLTNHD